MFQFVFYLVILRLAAGSNATDVEWAIMIGLAWVLQSTAKLHDRLKRDDEEEDT